MFSKQPELPLTDLSTDLLDEDDWRVGILKIFDLPLHVTALAIEPIARILAVGTSNGVIHVFGRSGVECKINLPRPCEVRFLQFAITTYNIVCLDSENLLHVYTLLDIGKPKFVTSVLFDHINSMTLSPSHAHIFLATQHGDIKTFDLTCLRKSSYSISNLWKLYEAKMTASGVPSLPSPDPSTVQAVDVVIHPRNLDLLFVAYAGGIILTDLTERSTIRAYELIIVPGASGGAGYGSHDILTHRRPMVTSMAIHPSGHFFAAGYDDGSIAFWAVEDDNKPLLVRTLDAVDVDILDPKQLDTLLAESDTTANKPISCPEPIFKLSWSSFPDSPDPRGGQTTLTILGGLTPDKPLGVSVFLFPPFNPSETPSTPSQSASSIHPYFRTAMCNSLDPSKTFFYHTRGVVQDHLLVGQNTPHFGGNFDPYAILLITELETTRTIEGYQFPPPGFLHSPQVPIAQTAGDDSRVVKDPIDTSNLSAHPISTSSRQANSAPGFLVTPFYLSAGNSGILGGRLLELDKEVYQTLANEESHVPGLNLKGGHAYAETTNELKLLKYQPRRVLFTRNRDLSVQFFDFSPQLLLPNPTANSLLEHDWPEALPGMTIRLHKILDDPTISPFIMGYMDTVRIDHVDVAFQALEVVLTLTSGEIVVYHSAENQSKSNAINRSADNKIVLLDHLYSQPKSKLVPYFLLVADKGPVATCALSDIGFLAVSYRSGSLAIVDMRGPTIMYATQTNNRRNRHSVMRPLAHLHNETTSESELDIIQTLTWAVCPLAKDTRLGVRLIAVHQSGHTEVYTLTRSGHPISWSIAGEPIICKASPDPIQNGTFILDTKTGAPLRADRGRLAACFKAESGGPYPASGQGQCLFITVGSKGARSAMDITGEKISKIEWGHKIGNAQASQIVEHMGSHALVIQTDKDDGLVYSLPHLEHICTFKLPSSSLPVTIDDSGDFISFTCDAKTQMVQSLVYGTLFHIRRAHIPPAIDFAVTRGVVPPQPQPVSLGPASLLGSWFSLNQTLSGNQIDELLGGPDRPIPEKMKSRDNGTAPQEATSGPGTTVAGLAASAAAAQASIYDRLSSAMNERGQLLGDLGERFNSLEEGSRSMAAQAKRMVAQQSAKSWFGL